MADPISELEVSLERERAARAEAEEANRSKNRFLAAISHELRAPLTTLLMWERLLRLDSEDPALRTRALDAIHDSVMLQSRLVADLLDVSRASTGKLRVELAELEIGPLLEAAFERARVVAPTAQHVFERRIADDLGTVRGDATRLQQVLDNLLANAVKFTPMGGRITFAAWRDGDDIVISISDTGCGIPPELLPQVFEPFSQASEALGGLGLGLSVAQQLVLLHHGSLTAASEGPGTGATFTLRLPRAEPAMRPPVLADVRVLLVDDDLRVLDALQLLLERMGASVAVVTSAAAAWEALTAERFDAIVSDIAMPGEDGYQLAHQIRSSTERFRSIPAIALTAHASLSDRRRALAAGFDLHVSKPVDVDALVEGIARLVTVWRAQA